MASGHGGSGLREREEEPTIPKGPRRGTTAEASYLPSLDPKVPRHRVPGLDPGQLALTKLARTVKEAAGGRCWGEGDMGQVKDTIEPAVPSPPPWS